MRSHLMTSVQYNAVRYGTTNHCGSFHGLAVTATVQQYTITTAHNTVQFRIADQEHYKLETY